MTRRRGLHRVLDTVQQAVGLGYDPVKMRAVPLQSQPHARHRTVQWLNGTQTSSASELLQRVGFISCDELQPALPGHLAGS